MSWVGRRLGELPGALAYLAVGAVTGVVAMFAVVGLVFVAGLCLIGVGLPAVPEALKMVRPLVRVERRRTGKRLGEPIEVSYVPFTGDLRQRLRAVVADPANRRDIGYLCLHAVAGLPLAIIAVSLAFSVVNQLAIPSYWQLLPPGTISNFGFTVDGWTTAILSALLAIPVGALTLQMPRVARWQALTARALLGPAEGAMLAHRVAELTETRAAALDAHGAELRRIERDLHDGAQARIAAVIMQLGLAEQLRERDREAADDMVRKAQDTAHAALAELRDVVRTVYPPVLADRGLYSAVSALAARSPIPCVLNIDGSTAPDAVGVDSSQSVRRPAAVEAAAYFVIAEALTNATKHSGAQQVSVRLGGDAERLIVEVIDDGVGAAHETEGGGLAGIRRRAEALDGRMLLTSPAGGTTVVRVELPCGS
ncbi:sensor histidine kinase [Nocardia crassostreae]|uniref:sensor histidine kinase n=1 Tax=Nocardia crassostreae TaxID=53428 RepID=UPI00082D24D4|nr:sensor histidine kinase [Nocardia crassostreae]